MGKSMKLYFCHFSGRDNEVCFWPMPRRCINTESIAIFFICAMQHLPMCIIPVCGGASESVSTVITHQTAKPQGWRDITNLVPQVQRYQREEEYGGTRKCTQKNFKIIITATPFTSPNVRTVKIDTDAMPRPLGSNFKFKERVMLQEVFIFLGQWTNSC